MKNDLTKFDETYNNISTTLNLTIKDFDSQKFNNFNFFCLTCKLTLNEIKDLDYHLNHHLIKKLNFDNETEIIEKLFDSLNFELKSSLNDTEMIKNDLKYEIGNFIDELHLKLEEIRIKKFEEIDSLLKVDRNDLNIKINLIRNEIEEMITKYKQEEGENNNQSLSYENDPSFLLLLDTLTYIHNSNIETVESIHKIKDDFWRYKTNLIEKKENLNKIIEEFIGSKNTIIENENFDENNDDLFQINYETDNSIDDATIRLKNNCNKLNQNVIDNADEIIKMKEKFEELLKSLKLIKIRRENERRLQEEMELENERKLKEEMELENERRLQEEMELENERKLKEEMELENEIINKSIDSFSNLIENKNNMTNQSEIINLEEESKILINIFSTNNKQNEIITPNSPDIILPTQESNIQLTSENKTNSSIEIIRLHSKNFQKTHKRCKSIENNYMNTEYNFINSPFTTPYTLLTSSSLLKTNRKNSYLHSNTTNFSPMKNKSTLDKLSSTDICKPITGTNELYIYDRKKCIRTKRKINLDKSIHGLTYFLEGSRNILIEDKFIMTGGRDKNGEYNIVLSYDINRNVMSRLDDMNYSHCYHTLEYFQKENILIIIGGQNNKHCEMYELNNLKWKMLPDLNVGRANVSVYLHLKEKCIYALFGKIGEITIDKHSDVIEVLNLKEINVKWVKLDYKNQSVLDFKMNYCEIYPLSKDKLLIYGANVLRNPLKTFAIFDLLSKQVKKVDKKLMEEIRVEAQRSTRLSIIIQNFR